MLARAEAEKVEIKPKTLNLHQFCDRILEEVKTERTRKLRDFLSLPRQSQRGDLFR